MNAETVLERSYKYVVEEVFLYGFQVTYTPQGSKRYVIYTDQGEFIRKFQNLTSLIRFFSTTLKLQASCIEDLVYSERYRLLTENEDAFKEYKSTLINTIQRKNPPKVNRHNRHPDEAVKTSTNKNIQCPFCKYRKVVTHKKGDLYTEYQCRNCRVHHYRDIYGDVMRSTRSTANLNGLRVIHQIEE